MLSTSKLDYEGCKRLMFSPSLLLHIPLNPNILSSYLLRSETPSTYILPFNVKDQFPHPYRTTANNIPLYIFIFMSSDKSWDNHNVVTRNNYYFEPSKIQFFQIIYTNSVRNSHETYYVSATKTTLLILFRRRLAICCENHRKNNNSLCGQNAEF
jgi:hypothetical protein